MEDRRCRKVMAIVLATVIILSVSGQTVYAAPGKADENLFHRLWGFKISILGSVGTDVREAVFNGMNEIKLLVAHFNKRLSEEEMEVESQRDDNVIIELLPLPHAQEIVVKDEAEKAQEPEQKQNQQYEPEILSFSRGGELLREDFELLARIIHAEARGESFEGQVAVGAVVLNRVESPDFPMTIREVIYQPGQFTAVDDGQIRLAPNRVAFLAAQAALEGHDPTNGAMYYYNPRIATDRWIRTRAVKLTIGNHDFCI